ncbi:leucine-twenty homeobox, partial [Fukomys damarensis]|uniref:leucine-twenty homeobox n=1 Tax=Fukomys damarensis TaxID=885580 RepID=UPI00145562F8
FEKDTHPDTDAIHELQSKLNLEEAVIKIWFKNQRMKQKKIRLRVQQEASPGTSTQHVLEKEEAALPNPKSNASPIAGTSEDGNHEPSESHSTRRHEAPAWRPAVDSQCDDIQHICLQDWDVPWAGTPGDINQFIELYALPEEDDPSSLDIYLSPRCLQ